MENYHPPQGGESKGGGRVFSFGAYAPTIDFYTSLRDVIDALVAAVDTALECIDVDTGSYLGGGIAGHPRLESAVDRLNEAIDSVVARAAAAGEAI